MAFKRVARYGCGRVLDNSRKEGTQTPGWNEYVASISTFILLFFSILKFDLIDIILLAYKGFAAPYTSAVKEPDACILLDTLPLPTVVVETGWPESWPRLDADKDLWLVGGASVELVLLVRWTKISGNRVKGDLHVHGKNPAGNVVLLQTEVSNCHA